jgi:hypothetical protein
VSGTANNSLEIGVVGLLVSFWSRDVTCNELVGKILHFVKVDLIFDSVRVYLKAGLKRL